MQNRHASQRCSRSLSLVASVLVLCSCSGELPSPSRVDKLRLFSLHADSPEVLPGAGIQVNAVFVDGSTHTGRTIFWTWKLCAESVTRESRRCLRPEEGTVLVDGVANISDVFLSPLLLAPTPPTTANTTYFVLGAMCPDAPARYDPATFQYVCPSEEFVPNADREGIQAFRTVTVRMSEPLNHNPAIAQVLLDGVVVNENDVVQRAACGGDAGTCSGVSIKVIAAPGAVELRSDGTPETLLLSFFGTLGRFDRPRAVGQDNDPLGIEGALSATWTPSEGATRTQVWLVLRDGRGGDNTFSFSIVTQ